MTVYEGVVCCRYLLIDGCDIYLAAVLAALLVPGAEEGVSDGLLVARGVEHVLAVTIVNHWHRHLVQNVGDTAT